MEEKHPNVTLLGESKVLLYDYVELQGEFKIREKSTIIDRPVIWEGYLDEPLLQVGDVIYHHWLKQELKIIKIIKTTMNTYIYHTDYQVGEVLQNEYTKKSLENVKSDIEMIKEIREIDVLSKLRDVYGSVD